MISIRNSFFFKCNPYLKESSKGVSSTSAATGDLCGPSRLTRCTNGQNHDPQRTRSCSSTCALTVTNALPVAWGNLSVLAVDAICVYGWMSKSKLAWHDAIRLLLCSHWFVIVLELVFGIQFYRFITCSELGKVCHWCQAGWRALSAIPESKCCLMLQLNTAIIFGWLYW